MFLAWELTPDRKLVIAIIDKTVLNEKRQEHISLNWVLNHERFLKNNTELYRLRTDYFGFFPLKDEEFRLKGLERFSEAQLQQLTTDADAVYMADAYGIYRNEWYKVNDPKDRSPVVYGGMSQQDMYYLDQMKAAHKLVIAEFNCIASPTSDSIRTEFSKSFGITWSRWVGRYFDSFDTLVNLELPKWVYHNYMDQNNGQWPFKKSGLAYVRNDDKIVILENDTHLDKELPVIISNAEGQDYYGLPEKYKYAYWFEINTANDSLTRTISTFETYPNAAGLKVLQENGIPVTFPAVCIHKDTSYQFFYFSADFCDNPITLGASYFRGIKYFQWLLFNSKDPIERKSFFWVFYRPLVTRILNDYYKSLGRK